MNKLRRNQFRQILTILLIICLSLPGTAFGASIGKKGQKDFKEGLKHEVAEQWDQAANEFAKAVAADPGNAEYRLHLFRALQGASIMFMKRGDELLKQNDYSSAYNAYRQAAAYDQTNELARVKMERIVEQQKALATGAQPVSFDPRTGNARSPENIELAPQQRSNDLSQNIVWRETGFKTLVTGLAQRLGLNVIMDETVKDSKVSLQLQNTTEAKALDNLLLMTKHTFEQIDRRTIFVYQDNPTNRQRYERLYLKTFYLGNVELQTAQQVIQQMLTGTAKQAVPLKQQNALVVRASRADLKVIQQILNSLDKSRPEVVIDVNIYEVSQSNLLQIGNQLASSSSTITSPERKIETKNANGTTTVETIPGTSTLVPGLNNLAGFRPNLAQVAGAALVGGGLSQFAFLGLPTSGLSLLQSKGNSKQLASTQVHALDGEPNETKIGKKVPISLGAALPGVVGTPAVTPGTNGAVGSALGALGGYGGYGSSLGYSSIQYQDVGLVIKVTPTISNDGTVQVKMDLTSSGVEAAATAEERLTPTITQRSITTVSRIADGQTAVVAGVKQQTDGNTRTSVPVIGMVPLLGRLFTAPKQDNSTSDIVITVTPHIIRSAEINPKDHLANGVGTLGGGNYISVEEIISSAQTEEEQERRMIAAQRGNIQNQTAGAPVQTNNALVAETTEPRYNPSPKVDVINDPIPTPTAQTASNGGLTQPPRIGAPVPTPTPAVASQPDRRVVENASLPVKPKQQPTTAPPEMPKNVVINEAGQPRNKAAVEDIPEDQRQYIPEGPTEPVKPAQVVPSRRPENFDKMMKEKAKEAEANPKPEPVKTPEQIKAEEDAAIKKFMSEVPPGPAQPVKPATVVPSKPKAKSGTQPAGDKPAENKPTENKPTAQLTGKPGAAMVELNMMPTVIKGQVGKSFILVLTLDGQSTMTGANIALKYDPNMLQVKAVRDGGLLGRRPDITHQVEGGNLTISMQQASEKDGPVKTSGRLLIVEFTAVGNGQTAIDVNPAETQLMMAGAPGARINATAAQVQISGEAVSRLSNER